jgi:hypothetical protein
LWDENVIKRRGERDYDGEGKLAIQIDGFFAVIACPIPVILAITASLGGILRRERAQRCFFIMQNVVS